jgi:MOSC domain-containing protein YiiM
MAQQLAAHIHQISVSGGGVPKRSVPLARVDELGIEGDKHRDAEHHGGAERALCLFSLELIEALRAEGHPIQPGAVGENLTTSGLDFALLSPGDRFRLGSEVIIELTRPTIPCQNISDAFQDARFVRISPKVNPGWSRFYARVLRGGEIRPGDPILPL